MARKKRRRSYKKNPDYMKMLHSKTAYALYGVAAGFAARHMIEGSMVGDLLDDTLGKVFGTAEAAAEVAVNGLGAIGMGAIGMSGAHMGGAHMGAIGMGGAHMGAIGMSGPTNAEAEYAARMVHHQVRSHHPQNYLA